MNERIRELAKEAGFYKYGNDFEEIIEKFAQLVAEECGRVLEDNELGGYRVDHVLREHFEDRE